MAFFFFWLFHSYSYEHVIHIWHQNNSLSGIKYVDTLKWDMEIIRKIMGGTKRDNIILKFRVEVKLIPG